MEGRVSPACAQDALFRETGGPSDGISSPTEGAIKSAWVLLSLPFVGAGATTKPARHLECEECSVKFACCGECGDIRERPPGWKGDDVKTCRGCKVDYKL